MVATAAGAAADAAPALMPATVVNATFAAATLEAKRAIPEDITMLILTYSGTGKVHTPTQNIAPQLKGAVKTTSTTG